MLQQNKGRLLYEPLGCRICVTPLYRLVMQCYYCALNPTRVAKCSYKYSKFEFSSYETCVLGCGKTSVNPIYRRIFPL